MKKLGKKLGRPRTGLWVKFNVDGQGLHILSAALDEVLGFPPALGWEARMGSVLIWPASLEAQGRVKVTRPRRARVRQFRSRALGDLVPRGKFFASVHPREPRWVVITREDVL